MICLNQLLSCHKYIFIYFWVIVLWLNNKNNQSFEADFPGSSVGKQSTCNAGDVSLIPWSGRSAGDGNDSMLQLKCLGDPMEKVVWQATVHGVSRVEHDWVTKPQLPNICNLFCLKREIVSTRHSLDFAKQ